MDIPVPKSKEVVAKLREFFCKGGTTIKFGDTSVFLAYSQLGVWLTDNSIVVETVPATVVHGPYSAFIPSIPVCLTVPFDLSDPVVYAKDGMKFTLPHSAVNPQVVKVGNDFKVCWSKGGRPSATVKGWTFEIASILITESYGKLDIAGVPGLFEPRLVWKD